MFKTELIIIPAENLHFLMYLDTGNLQPILYTSKDGMRKVAVVTGFQKPIDEVIGILQNAKFMGRKLRVLKVSSPRIMLQLFILEHLKNSLSFLGHWRRKG